MRFVRDSYATAFAFGDSKAFVDMLKPHIEAVWGEGIATEEGSNDIEELSRWANDRT